MKILLVDDEKLLVKGIKFSLEQDGYTVVAAYNGSDAIRLARDKSISLIILDLMLPEIDGLTVCQKVREFSNVPIIMLSAKSYDSDKILGLEYGADDYMTKPFNIMELKTRIKVIFRRMIKETLDNKDKLKLPEGMKLDYNSRTFTRNDIKMELTSKEFELLELLISNRGRVYSRENLLNIIWGYDYDGDERTVDVHMRRLREKIEPNPAKPEYILTKWGVGYYFKED
jgi:DNA-binding response OmpR family regulator